MSAQTQAEERKLWSQWSVATLIGWAVGMVAGIGVTYAIMALLGIEEETNLFAYLLMGAGIALAQMVGVRRRLELGARWVWGYVAGMGIPFAAGAAPVPHATLLECRTDLRLALVGAIGGLLTGVFQMPSLRPYTGRLFLWPLFSTVTWGVAWATVGLVGPLAELVLGVFNGGAVVWLMRVPAREVT
jgi:hypothetical protein